MLNEAVEMKMTCKEHKCKYQRKIPGDAHIRCAHPLIEEMYPILKEPFTEALAMLGGMLPNIQEVIDILGIQGIYTGIKRGWFNWPFNFDPLWLAACNGFEEDK